MSIMSLHLTACFVTLICSSLRSRQSARQSLPSVGPQPAAELFVMPHSVHAVPSN